MNYNLLVTEDDEWNVKFSQLNARNILYWCMDGTQTGTAAHHNCNCALGLKAHTRTESFCTHVVTLSTAPSFIASWLFHLDKVVFLLVVPFSIFFFLLQNKLERLLISHPNGSGQARPCISSEMMQMFCHHSNSCCNSHQNTRTERAGTPKEAKTLSQLLFFHMVRNCLWKDDMVR